MSEFFLTIPGGFMQMLQAEIMALAFQVPDEFKNLGHMVGVTAYDAAELYDGYLKGHDIPGYGALKRPAQLKGKVICRPLNALSWDIGHEDGNARFIEEGTPERDMKLSLATAPKARAAKDGSKYLIIPFRHGSNGEGKGTRGFAPMPKAVYKLAKAMSFSHHLGQNGTRLSATGHNVPLYAYQWGDSLKAGMAAKSKPWHVTDLYDGMYRFKDAGTKGKKSAGYITFRVMSQKSDARAWIRPAQPGLHPLDTAMKEAWDANVPFLEAALWEDIQVLWNKAKG